MRYLLLVFLATAGCIDSENAAGSLAEGKVEVGSLTQAVGEPQNGYPTPEERLGLMALNRARSDPSTVRGASSAMYPARPPVMWSYDLSRSSRFHATNLQSAKASLMHTSPCRLNANVATANCTGLVACACATPVPQNCANCGNVAAINNCGTDTFVRISYFSNIGNGEIAAAGYGDVFATVDGWMDEAAGADGHRRNITDQGVTSNTMGFGHAGAGGCWSSFDVSDSGNEGGISIPAIPSAAVKPSAPSPGSARFYATWVEGGGAPQSLYAVVDGKCTAMTKELGSPTLNSTWQADVNLAGGCHTWYVLGKSAGGSRSTYPTTGAIYVAVGGASCSDYTQQAPGADCEGMVAQPDLSMKPNGSHDLAMPHRTYDFAVAGGGDGGGTSGNIGSTCHAHADCQSGVCAFFAASDGYCTAMCDPLDVASCPAGYICGVIDGANYCLRGNAGGHGGGGCVVAPGTSPGAPWLVLMVLPALLVRRHRRRCRR